MPEVVEEAPLAENDFQSASPGGPCDICVSCDACNPENMSELTVDLSTASGTMGEFVTSNMAIWKAMPPGNIHNVEVGGILVSGFKTTDGELRLNTTDKYSPDIVTRKGTDYLNPETAPAPKTFDLANAQINPEMQARFREQLRLRKSSTQPEIKKENRPPQPIQPEQQKTIVAKDSAVAEHLQPEYPQHKPEGASHNTPIKEKPVVIKQSQSESEDNVSHRENTDSLTGGSDNKPEKTAVTIPVVHHMEQSGDPSMPKNPSYSTDGKTVQTSHIETSTSIPEVTKKESPLEVQTDTPPRAGDVLSNSPNITAPSLEEKPIVEPLDIKPDITQSLNQKKSQDTEDISSAAEIS
jgi:hypothetical protein